MFITDDLLTAIWDEGLPHCWKYKSGGHTCSVFKGQLDMKQLRRFLAVQIRITGLQNQPVEGNNEKKPQRTAIREATAHFRESFPNCTGPGISIVEFLCSQFRIHHKHFEKLSRNFQSVLLDLGQVVAGDEKLLHFTGASDDVRDVKSKPDRIGLWFYQLMASLPGSTQFCLHMKLNTSATLTMETSPVWRMVGEWADIVNRHSAATASITLNPNTILVFDSFYMTNASAQACEQRGVKFIGSCKSNNFNSLVEMVKYEVLQKGDWAGVYSEEKERLFIHKWDKDQKIGKKYVLTNAFIKRRKSRKFNFLVPAYDLYKTTFSACDKFNRNLHDRKYPHRSGGGRISGDSGHHHKFALATTLQNTFAMWNSLKARDGQDHSFLSLCLELADALYE